MSPTATKKKEKVLGKVTHYYGHIGVAVVELAAPLKVGDMICLKHGDQKLCQAVVSLQVDHDAVPSAKKGQIVGMKVDVPVHAGTLIVAA